MLPGLNGGDKGFVIIPVIIVLFFAILSSSKNVGSKCILLMYNPQ